MLNLVVESFFPNLFMDQTMKTLIHCLIRSSNGYYYETAGMLFGFFNDPTQAHVCAIKIMETTGQSVEVCGCQLSAALQPILRYRLEVE